jgi:hypothetical protein
MLPKILSKVGLPFLVKYISSSLSSIDNPTAIIASQALDKVDYAIKKNEISVEEIIEANRHLETMEEIGNKSDLKMLEVINRTIIKEAQSDDKFIRRWRPTFGYAVAVTWVMVMSSISYTIIKNPISAVAVVNSMVNTTPLWGVALAVLGISVIKRSQDKLPSKKTGGVISKIIKKIS